MGSLRTLVRRVGSICMSVPGLAACASYVGTARDAEPARIASDRGWLTIRGVRSVEQRSTKDCGAAALSSVLEYWGYPATPQAIEGSLTREIGNGILAGELKAYAERQGLLAFVFYGTIADLERELRSGRPTIVGVAKPFDDRHLRLHYEVVVGYHPADKRILTLDPARGLRENTLQGFEREWAATGNVTLVVFKAPAEARLDAAALDAATALAM